MLARVRSAALVGLDGVPVDVEVDLGAGLPAFEIVGLPDAAVRESKDRVRAALKNSGFDFPIRRITVNLAPAHWRKAGPAFDLPIALGILAASGQLPGPALDHFLCIGELSLDGRVQPVQGAVCLAGAGAGRRVMLPAVNALEAEPVAEQGIAPIADLVEAVAWVRGRPVLVRSPRVVPSEPPTPGPDLAEVRGQVAARRALELVAAGGHHAVLIGPPGVGKTLLARSLPGVLPPLSLAESVSITKIYSVRGLLPEGGGLVRARPFRSPHHTTTGAALIGGGAAALPGEVSLAHGGVLFLDEMGEFRLAALEALRQPLEDGFVQLVRGRQAHRFPARFALVGATNPCPCGYRDHPLRRCRCREADRARYDRRWRGPIADRIDLWVRLRPVTDMELFGAKAGEPSAAVAARVREARLRQAARFAGRPVALNAAMGPAELAEFCPLGREAAALLRQARARLDLSARAVARIIKVARTVADLDDSAPESGEVQAAHVAEAIQYRDAQ